MDLLPTLKAAGFCPFDNQPPHRLRLTLSDGAVAEVASANETMLCTLLGPDGVAATMVDATPLVLEATIDFEFDELGRERQVVQMGYCHHGMFITQPAVSDCGRFEADPRTDNGLQDRWAQALTDLNARLAAASPAPQPL